MAHKPAFGPRHQNEEETMNLWIVLPAIALLAFAYVLLPVVLTTFSRYRRLLFVECPETRARVRVRFQPVRAALSACFGRPALRVTSCSQWPDYSGCREACGDLPESEMVEVSDAPGSSEGMRQPAVRLG
jgi:hypothetical protein